MTDRQRLLQMALKGLEADLDKLDWEIKGIKRELGQVSAGPRISGDSTSSPTKRTMSAAARRKISQGMKRRYAELRKAIRAAKK